MADAIALQFLSVSLSKGQLAQFFSYQLTSMLDRACVSVISAPLCPVGRARRADERRVVRRSPPVAHWAYNQRVLHVAYFASRRVVFMRWTLSPARCPTVSLIRLK